MHERFRSVVDALHPSLQQLMAIEPAKPLHLPKTAPQAGIYLLSEGSRHLYVGRSNRIRKRLSNHCRVSATYKMAAFAFKLARESTGRLKATYKTEGSRADLITDAVFANAFAEAKARIRDMDVRFVAASEPICQALLEVYVAVALNTPYNDFDTH